LYNALKKYLVIHINEDKIILPSSRKEDIGILLRIKIYRDLCLRRENAGTKYELKAQSTNRFEAAKLFRYLNAEMFRENVVIARCIFSITKYSVQKASEDLANRQG